MPVQIPTGYSQITIQYDASSSAGSRPATVFGVSEAPNTTTLGTILDWIDTDLIPLIDSSQAITQVRMIDELIGLQSDVVRQGGRSMTAAPPNTCALIKKGTLARGAANRGRIYQPYAVAQGEVAEFGDLQSSVVTSINGAWQSLLATLAATNSDMVILHTGVGLPTPVLSLQCQTRAATQRRRLRR